MRELWVDYAKAIGIILVVIGHMNRGLYNSGIYISKEFYLITDSIIYTFHMPLFFFLSGLFFTHSLRYGKAWFIKNKIKTILYPYIVWSVIQGVVEVAISQHTNAKTSLSSVLAFPYYPRAQFWFLYALFMILILSCVIYKKKSFVRSLPLLIAISIFLYSFSHELGTFAHLDFITKNIVYFFLGCYLTTAIEYLNKIKPKHITMTHLFIALTLLFSFLQYKFHFIDKKLYYQVGFYSLILASVSILWISLLSYTLSRFSIKSLKLIGELSMVIYLLHILASSGTRIVLSKILNINDWHINMLAGTFLGVFLPMLYYFISKRTKLMILLEWPTAKVKA
ncbi:acyltransferase/acetyltransferase [Klebsiella quasipneumoniae]|uniref:acyltransferase family protein n=1 Tax=Klebsiella quasipneumoniae TaxID=1463165 RepID=UPI0015DCCAE2|nr:acyltransferase [Klebsiella quasipneumoniae]MBC4671288.1 acyltransferase [Klebsiella quasipneumoniae]BBS21724.1 acyltransferase/acetyltransferase [Klebsiella quasipneumoniae]